MTDKHPSQALRTPMHWPGIHASPSPAYYPQLLFPTLHRRRRHCSVTCYTFIYSGRLSDRCSSGIPSLSFTVCRWLLSCALNRSTYWCNRLVHAVWITLSVCRLCFDFWKQLPRLLATATTVAGQENHCHQQNVKIWHRNNTINDFLTEDSCDQFTMRHRGVVDLMLVLCVLRTIDAWHCWCLF